MEENGYIDQRKEISGTPLCTDTSAHLPHLSPSSFLPTSNAQTEINEENPGRHDKYVSKKAKSTCQKESVS